MEKVIEILKKNWIIALVIILAIFFYFKWKKSKDAELKAIFTPIANELTTNEGKINEELIAAQGKPQNIGGYYHPSFELTDKAMRPSETLNTILAKLN
jgi:isocitrate dehydrogenase